MNSYELPTTPGNVKTNLPSTARARWGIPLFDNNHAGLPPQAFNILETEDSFSGLLGIARFIATGLEQGENVTLVTFGSPERVLNKFLKLGYDFKSNIQSERMFIMSYKSNLTRSLNISADYQTLFAEITHLSKDRSTRLAFLNADLLFNLESHSLTVLSVSRIHEAASSIGGTILAQFTTVDALPHKRLRDISTSLLDCYLIIRQSAASKVALEVKVCH